MADRGRAVASLGLERADAAGAAQSDPDKLLTARLRRETLLARKAIAARVHHWMRANSKASDTKRLKNAPCYGPTHVLYAGLAPSARQLPRNSLQSPNNRTRIQDSPAGKR